MYLLRKTEAGIIDVVIPSTCQWILKRLKMLNPFGEFIFMSNGERIRTYVFRNRLNTVCKHSNVKQKSPHKIRKTYGSILLDDGLAESLIISQMGHTNIKLQKNIIIKIAGTQSRLRKNWIRLQRYKYLI